MAYLIECDRCGSTENVTSSAEIPNRWLQFNQIWRGDGSGTHRPIEGGVFCPSCTSDLEKWRRPIPRCAPMPEEDFRKRA